jgi:dTDP-4-amino-4,6-dideoxygalactose transaminase
MFAVTLDPEAGIERDTFIDAMREQNIGTSVHYIPTHLFTAYRDLPRRELPNTEVLGARLVSLPLYPTMTDRDVDDVVDAVHAVYSRELKPVPS